MARVLSPNGRLLPLDPARAVRRVDRLVLARDPFAPDHTRPALAYGKPEILPEQLGAWAACELAEDVIGVSDAVARIPAHDQIALPVEEATGPFLRLAQFPDQVALRLEIGVKAKEAPAQPARSARRADATAARAAVVIPPARATTPVQDPTSSTTIHTRSWEGPSGPSHRRRRIGPGAFQRAEGRRPARAICR